MSPFMDHQLLAAVRVARIMDAEASSSHDAARSFPLVISQGEHRTGDLQAGLTILIEAGLILEDGPTLTPKATMFLLGGLADGDAVRYLRGVFTHKANALARIESGAAGEAAVVEACRAELISLGRADLAVKVKQMSLLDDTLGFDVSAPTLTDRVRLLEVKTTARPPEAIFVFFLSRNEYEVGYRESAWAMIACAASGASTEIIGWCRGSALTPYLPDDRRGHWTEALVRIPRSVLLQGLPPAV